MNTPKSKWEVEFENFYNKDEEAGYQWTVYPSIVKSFIEKTLKEAEEKAKGEMRRVKSFEAFVLVTYPHIEPSGKPVLNGDGSYHVYWDGFVAEKELSSMRGQYPSSKTELLSCTISYQLTKKR